MTLQGTRRAKEEGTIYLVYRRCPYAAGFDSPPRHYVSDSEISWITAAVCS